MFGGNSNWRGPLWFPLNYLVIDALERYHRFFGDEFTVEYPTGSGHQLPLDAIVADLRGRLVSIFMVGPDGRRPCFGGVERLQTRPGLEGQPRVQRVLPRRQRRRPRRVAPDRVDRDRGRPDPAHGTARCRRSATRCGRRGPRRRRRERRAGGCGRACGAPLGATVRDGGTNFAVASASADGMLLCLFDEHGAETRIPLPDRDAGVWHGVRAGRRPRPGVRVPRHRALRPGPRSAVQPGQTAARPVRPGDQRRGPVRSGGPRPRARRSRRAEHPRLGRPRAAQPGDGRRPPVDHGATVARPAIRRHGRLRGPRQGLHRGPPRRPGSAARHVRRARLTRPPSPTCSTSVSPPSSCSRSTTTCPSRSSPTGASPTTGATTRSATSRRTPATRLRSGPGRPGGQVAEFKAMVDAPARAPGSRCCSTSCSTTPPRPATDGPTLCFRGLDNPAYYRLDPDDPRRYVDTTGCGNSINAGDPLTLQLIMDSLRYWLTEMRRRRLPIRPGPHAGAPGRRLRPGVGLLRPGVAGPGGVAVPS